MKDAAYDAMPDTFELEGFTDDAIEPGENSYGENPCQRCGGTGLTNINWFQDGIEHDADDVPCPDCLEMRKLRDVMRTI
jgi:hypothetical protein